MNGLTQDRDSYLLALKQAIAIMPGIGFLKDSQYRYIAASDELNQKMRCGHSEEFMGRSDFDVPGEHRENAGVYRAQDILISQGEPTKGINIQCYPQDTERKVYYTMKKPLYLGDEFIGIYGTTIEIDRNFINSLLDKGIINKKYCEHHLQRNALAIAKLSHPDLSERESICLYFLIRGRTAKEISQKMNVSPKTVESYIARVKVKLQCYSKSQLIDKAYELQLDKVIPEAILAL